VIKCKQGVALMGSNRPGQPCSVGRPTAHAPGVRRADRPRARRPAALQTTTTDASPLSGPVISKKCTVAFAHAGPATSWALPRFLVFSSLEYLIFHRRIEIVGNPHTTAADSESCTIG